jgi:hypothetical protein
MRINQDAGTILTTEINELQTIPDRLVNISDTAKYARKCIANDRCDRRKMNRKSGTKSGHW